MQKIVHRFRAADQDGMILIDTAEGRKEVPRKAAALVKPVVDMEGIEEVDLSGDE